MGNNHVKKGNISEQQFILYCLNNDIKVSRPVFNDARYDFIIDINNKLLRVQVKTAYDSQTEERFVFNTSNSVCTMFTGNVCLVGQLEKTLETSCKPLLTLR